MRTKSCSGACQAGQRRATSPQPSGRTAMRPIVIGVAGDIPLTKVRSITSANESG